MNRFFDYENISLYLDDIIEYIKLTCSDNMKLMHYNYLYTLSSQCVCLQLLGHNGPFVGFYLKARPALRDKKFTAIFIQ